MLSNDTKKVIDDARDTLVGQIPVPMMQCQQITLALTYKFMSDDDEQAVELGGQRHYFTGGLEKYGWDKIMSLRLDDTQRSELYRAGLSALQVSNSLPAVFHEIFKDAMVPYGDHRTLALFLNTMNGMGYDDSEKLGEAYEYLLKTAEAQADAGQFRTPRHIIDFIVNIIDPQKHEVIIDPACGTAGFLVSAYQHVKSQHELPGGGTTLSIPDLTRLSDNLNGYDISPEMTKLAMVNMYLHTQDKNPNIANYDTLTSTDHWNEYADVMLANPPFMTPKGGIRPHSRFRVAAKKAEVLFVDYIASHLNEHGRAGIIVPEGIIFQSQNAYRQLRRILLDESLVAVISLPGGVFNPYSGVKTSILILDKILAPRADGIAFFKVDNDGYELGERRRPIRFNDLPVVTDEISGYLQRLRNGGTMDDYQATRGLIVPKREVAADEEYSLNGDRYREGVKLDSHFPYVRLDSVAKIVGGSSAPQGEEYFRKGEFPFIRTADVGAVHRSDNFIGTKDRVNQMAVDENRLREFPAGTILFPKSGASTFLNHRVVTGEQAYVASHLAGIICDEEKALTKFVYYMLCQIDARDITPDQDYPSLRLTEIASIETPLPPLEVQRELVAEIEGYQRVMDGARAVVDNWRPRIAVDPEWPMVEIGDICNLVNGRAFKPSDWADADSGGLPIVRIQNLNSERSNFNHYTGEVQARYIVDEGELLFSWSGSRGTSFGAHIWNGGKAILNQHIFKVEFEEKIAKKAYLYNALNRAVAEVEQNLHGGVGLVHITKGNLERIRIPLPPMASQEAIIAEIQEERAVVSANRELASKMEQRIQDAIVQVWEG